MLERGDGDAARVLSCKRIWTKDNIRRVQAIFNRRPPPQGLVARGAATTARKVERWTELGSALECSGM